LHFELECAILKSAFVHELLFAGMMRCAHQLAKALKTRNDSGRDIAQWAVTRNKFKSLPRSGFSPSW
jgi:hypothetical protein